MAQGEASTTVGDRIEQQIRSDSELEARLEAAGERKTRYLAGEVVRCARAVGHTSSSSSSRYPFGSEETETKRRRADEDADTHAGADTNVDERSSGADGTVPTGR